jgi:CheY-like chemotaxis protein
VDDDTRNSFALVQALKQLGLTITTVDDGQVAIDLLKQHNFDLILMDIMMPVMDGYTAIAAIKADGSLCHIPIIALTAKAMPDDEQKCLDAGADDYIAKPINLTLLSGKLRKWLTPD